MEVLDEGTIISDTHYFSLYRFLPLHLCGGGDRPGDHYSIW